MNNDFTVSQMLWKPKLLVVTNPTDASFSDKKMYFDPTTVRSIRRSFIKDDASREATVIEFSNNASLIVEERVEEVAKMCDEAFGYKWGKDD